MPLLAGGAFVGGGATAVVARATLDNQFDLSREGASTFAVGGVSGVATALTGGASQALTAGIGTQAARVVGQQAVQRATGQAAIRAGASAIVGGGVGSATSGAQAIASGQDAQGVAKTMALGALGGAAGSAATSGVSAALGRGARALQQGTAAGNGMVSSTVRAATRASETALGRSAGALTQGVVSGGTSGGAAALANQLASGQPVDFAAMRRQILAGAIQGGFSVAAGRAAAGLPKRSAVRAPLSSVDAQARINALAPEGNRVLNREFRELGDQYRQAQETALARMAALQAKHRGLTSVSDADARATALAEPVRAYGEAMAKLDGTRTQLLDFARNHLGRTQTLELARAVGEPNLDVAWDRPMNPGTAGKHNEAVAGFVTRFAELGLTDVAQPGVKGLSSRALQSISEALHTEASSADAKGAANVEHLASVLRGNLLTARREKGAPLTQAEVDTRAAVTVLTDAWMKGASPEVLASVRTASTNLGANGKVIYENMLARGLNIDSMDQVPSAIRPQLTEWFTRFGPPQTREAVAKALGDKGLSAADVGVWTDRIMARDKQVTNPFLLGTWLHGMPQFDAVNGVVKSMGGDRAMAQNYYEEVLAHHASGFVMDGFSRAKMNVNFYEMARAGQLTPEAAQRLTGLYTSSSALAGKWRPVIDMATSGRPLSMEQYGQFRQAIGLKPLSGAERLAYQQLNGGQGRPLTAQEYQMFRQRYSADAAPMRAAIARLIPNSRAQLLNDDSQQFTVIGMPKWINMMTAMGKPETNGELIDLVYRSAVQPYAEESYARGASVGSDFDQSTAPVAERLGMTLDPLTRTYRPAAAGEQGQSLLSARILANETLRARLNAGSLDATSPEAVIDWFRRQAVDPSLVTQLVQSNPTQ